MSDHTPVTKWIGQIRAGDDQAAEKVWQHFFQRLLSLACKRLNPGTRRVADEDDVVSATFNTVFVRLQAGQFPELKDRDDLWKLLVVIAKRKASNQMRDLKTKGRGGGLVLGESFFLNDCNSDSVLGIANACSGEPSPELAAVMKESAEELLDELDEDLRAIAILKLEGYSNSEIAERIKRSLPTVERRLRLIRAKWGDNEEETKS